MIYLDTNITPADMTFYFRLVVFIVLTVFALRHHNRNMVIAFGIYTITSFFFGLGRYDLSTVFANIGTVLIAYTFVMCVRKK